MTVDTGGGLGVAGSYRFSVKAAIVRRLLIGMALGAGNFLRSGFVRRTLQIGMAIDALKHAAMHGILEFIGVYVQADGLAADFVAQCGVAVASQAIVVAGLRYRLRAGRGQAGCQSKKSQRQNRFVPHPPQPSSHGVPLPFCLIPVPELRTIPFLVFRGSSDNESSHRLS